MSYYQVCLRNVPGIFTWEFDGPCEIGNRVIVEFRNSKKIGIVINISKEKPKYKTKKILEILNKKFLSQKYLELAKYIVEDNFSDIGKVLSLIVPKEFWQKIDVIKRDVFYLLDEKEIKVNLKKLGLKQQLAIDIIKKKNGKISKDELRKNISIQTINTLLKKKLLKLEVCNISRPKYKQKIERKKDHTLNSSQINAVKAISKTKKPYLLFGVTGSGKTEVYKYLAKKLIEEKEDGQMLFLVPEIALTSQLIAEFQNVFGKNIAVWHSGLSVGEKIQEWGRVVSGEARILIGARSAILVPMKNPKLIILDEEHEWTYKNEFSPRFLTHNLAEKIASLFDSKLVFGSATPRVESFYNVEQGNWNRVDLPNRVLSKKMPEIQLVDLKNETKKGNYSPISEAMEEELRKTLEKGKQAVIFLNKRGFSGSTMCKSCGYNFHCKNCSMPMKVHRKFKNKYAYTELGKLICHSCGYMENIKPTCPECSMKDFEFKGYGTQMVEDILNEKFPDAGVLRADKDTITKRHDFEDKMALFHNKKAQILLGTQMIAKGLDFEDVEFCGIILADVGLSLPDFRAEERVFQLLTQVSGRAGRRDVQGKILIQTYSPNEEIYNFVQNHKVEEFILWQKELRKKMELPPFKKIIKLTFSDRDKNKAFILAKKNEKLCKNFLSKDSSLQVNFAPAFFPRMNNKYHFHIFLKGNKIDLDKILKNLKLKEKDIKIDNSPISML